MRRIHPQLDAQRRQLRAEIARNRRQLERSGRELVNEARSLTSWQTYVRRYPAATLGAAFGLGLALRGLFARRSVRRATGRKLMTASLSWLGGRLLHELTAVWAESAPRSSAP